MTPRLWGRASSVNVQKVMWALAELGLAHERIDAGHTYGQTDTPEFAAMNPARRVPVWQEDGLTMFESNAILRHLSRREGRLMPQDLHGQAIADQWIEFASTSFQPPLLVIFFETVRLPEPKRSAARLEKAVAETADAARILDARLAQSRWLAGVRFGLADIAAGTMMHRYMTMPFERPALANLDRWRGALEERAPYRDTVMTSYEELRA